MKKAIAASTSVLVAQKEGITEYVAINSVRKSLMTVKIDASGALISVATGRIGMVPTEMLNTPNEKNTELAHEVVGWIESRRKELEQLNTQDQSKTVDKAAGFGAATKKIEEKMSGRGQGPAQQQAAIPAPEQSEEAGRRQPAGTVPPINPLIFQNGRD